jgi:hypothetical protein
MIGEVFCRPRERPAPLTYRSRFLRRFGLRRRRRNEGLRRNNAAQGSAGTAAGCREQSLDVRIFHSPFKLAGINELFQAWVAARLGTDRCPMGPQSFLAVSR